MSVHVSAAVWKQSAHAGTGLLLLLALADFSDEQGNSYPAVATLAKQCRMSVRNAGYILKALEASGELEVRPNEGPKGTNRYRIVLAALGKGVQPASGAPLQLAAGSGVQGIAGVGVQPTAPLQPVAPLQPASATPAIQRRLPLQPIADEPSLNRQEPSSIARSARAGGADAHPKGVKRVKAEHPLFAAFYAAYPRKVARSKAAEAFSRLDADQRLLDTMVKAIEAQGLARRCTAGEGRFVPHPATWLNGRRWEDGAPEAHGGAGNAPHWAESAGFASVFDAETAGCGPGNYRDFRNGQKVPA